MAFAKRSSLQSCSRTAWRFLIKLQHRIFFATLTNTVFSGYCLAFEASRHQFFPGVRFDDIQFAYSFDCKLRDLFNEALELLEVDISLLLLTTLATSIRLLVIPKQQTSIRG